jgi:hypothetical protein
VNRKPLKDELLLQGLSSGNLTVIKNPHSNTSLLGLPNKKTEGDNEIEERQEKRTPGHCSGVNCFLAQKSEEKIES